MGDLLDQKGADSFTTQARRFKAWEDVGLAMLFPFLWCVKEKIILRWIHQSYSEMSLWITAANHCACWSLYCAGEQLKS